MKTIKTIIIITIILLAVFGIRKCCLSDYESFIDDKRKKEQIKITADSIDKVKIHNENIGLQKKVDSLKKVTFKTKFIYIQTKEKTQDQIKQGICDTNRVKKLIKDCDETICLQDSTIAAQDTLIKNQKKEIELCDTLTYSYLNKLNILGKENEQIKSDLKKEEKKAKRTKNLAKAGLIITAAIITTFETLKLRSLLF